MRLVAPPGSVAIQKEPPERGRATSALSRIPDSGGCLGLVSPFVLRSMTSMCYSPDRVGQRSETNFDEPPELGPPQGLDNILELREPPLLFNDPKLFHHVP